MIVRTKISNLHDLLVVTEKQIKGTQQQKAELTEKTAKLPLTGTFHPCKKTKCSTLKKEKLKRKEVP